MEFEKGVTLRGVPYIIIDSFKYRKQRVMADKTVSWRCVFKQCGATVRSDAAGTALLTSVCSVVHRDHVKMDVKPTEHHHRAKSASKRKALEEITLQPEKISRRELHYERNAQKMVDDSDIQYEMEKRLSTTPNPTWRLRSNGHTKITIESPNRTPHKIQLTPPQPLASLQSSPAESRTRRRYRPNYQTSTVPNSENTLCLHKPKQIKQTAKQDVKSVSDSPCRTTQVKLTEYFPVRRSVRKTKREVLEEKQKSIETAVRNNVQDGLDVEVFENKGRGVVTTRKFSRGEFVVEYAGELISHDEARRREQFYAQDENTGSYMYYFVHSNKHYCIDATEETDRLGRLINHSRNGNLYPKIILIDKQPRLVLLANQDIAAGEEVTYDYGDRSKESIKNHPWLLF
ncbi:unnamed protein product [Bemisia tabaci]|uniref:[histone H4]-lysine(20) N-methyltransferase n=1 Tax=Bemisia tabaci TaxID=7038 RepID=A0A9P0ACE4_BEMTA|nr:unnamed protein product [Bemisia tabaci]